MGEASAESRASAAIRRRQAAGHFGTTDALRYILERYEVDLSDYRNATDLPGAGSVPALVRVLRDAAGVAVYLAGEVLRTNHRVRELAGEQATAMQGLADDARDDDVGTSCALDSPTIDLEQMARLAGYVTRVVTFKTALDAAMQVFTPKGGDDDRPTP